MLTRSNAAVAIRLPERALAVREAEFVARHVDGEQ
jgi:hypothetical protein